MLTELAIWLCTRVAGLVRGANLQVGFRPQGAPVRCHALIENGGPADFDLPYRTDMMLQVYTRGETIDQARTDAWAVYDAIQGTSGWTIGPEVSGGQAYKIWSIAALAKPLYIGEDEKGAHEFSTNYLIRVSRI